MCITVSGFQKAGIEPVVMVLFMRAVLIPKSKLAPNLK